MKWISFVEMENFKIHRYKRVDFGRFMNIMVGESDTGKSTILKALVKCLFNKPDRKADSFLTWGSPRGAKTIIRVGVKDDQNGRYDTEDAPETIIERVLGKSGTNEYNLYFSDGQVSNYAGFGKVVPPEVMAVHGMREVDMGYGKEQLNYMGQFDGFFLIGRRPEEVATAIGRLARTEIIDRVKEGLRSDIASNTRVLGQVRKDIAEEVTIIKSFDYLDETKEILEALDELKSYLIDQDRLVENQKTMSAKIKSSAITLESAVKTLEAGVDYPAAIKLLEEAETKYRLASEIHKRSLSPALELSERLSAVVDIIDNTPDMEAIEKHLDSAAHGIALSEKIATLDRSIKRKASALTDASGALEAVPDFNSVTDACDILSKLKQNTEVMTTLSMRIKKLALSIASQQTAIESARSALDTAKAALAESMDGRCPLCGSDVDASRLDEITLHLAEEGA